MLKRVACIFIITHQGCPVFEPPARGAFVCILVDSAIIYCSVYCENLYEFSATPLNPYFCGTITRFAWTDFTNVTHQELPKCTGWCNHAYAYVVICLGKSGSTLYVALSHFAASGYQSLLGYLQKKISHACIHAGFRHRLRTLYPDEFYLPTACDQLTENNITTIKDNFCSMYTFFTFMECNNNDVVIQCPRDG